jgi:hypothetical protein
MARRSLAVIEEEQIAGLEDASIFSEIYGIVQILSVSAFVLDGVCI